jgi:hypothetical protein
MKKLFFMILAVAIVVACQNPSPKSVDGDTRTVSVTIKKEVATRATMAEQVGAGDVTALTDGTLFFFNNAGSTVHTYHLTADDIDSELCTVSVPVSSVSVAMIANNAGTELAGASPASFGAFRLMTYGIDNQAKMAGAAGGTGQYPAAVQGIALVDMLDEGEPNPLTSVGENSYTATVNLAPVVARIEIGPEAIIVRTDNESNLESFTFNGIYVNRYASGYRLGLEPTLPLFGEDIAGGGSDDWAADYLALDGSTWLWDEVQTTITTTAGIGSFAWHIFPGAVPQIVIHGSGFDYSEGTGDIPDSRYWMIDKYWDKAGVPTDEGYEAGKGTPITSFECGTVYRIASITVGDTIPGDDPYDPEVTVEVTLSVVAWKEAGVYVEPK